MVGTPILGQLRASMTRPCGRIMTYAIEVDTSTKWRNFAELEVESKRKTQRPQFTNIKMRVVVDENTTLGADNEHMGRKGEVEMKIQ